jgi:hypothetical protein
MSEYFSDEQLAALYAKLKPRFDIIGRFPTYTPYERMMVAKCRHEFGVVSGEIAARERRRTLEHVRTTASFLKDAPSKAFSFARTVGAIEKGPSSFAARRLAGPPVLWAKALGRKPAPTPIGRKRAAAAVETPAPVISDATVVAPPAKRPRIVIIINTKAKSIRVERREA